MSQSRSSHTAFTTSEGHATESLASRFARRLHTIIEPIYRRKDIPGWTTLYTNLEATPAATAPSTETIASNNNDLPKGPPAAISRTEDVLPNLHPAMIYLVLFLVSIVLSTAILLYFVNFGTPTASLHGVYRKTVNFFRRLWFRTRTLYGDVIFKVQNLGTTNQPYYVRIESEAEDHRRRRERDCRSPYLDNLDEDLADLRQLRTVHEKLGESNAKLNNATMHDQLVAKANAPQMMNFSNLPVAPQWTQTGEQAEATSSGYEVARVYASPSIFRFPHSSTQTQDFASGSNGNTPPTTESANWLTVPRSGENNNNNNSTRFRRSPAPSPSSYSPTPSAIAEANATPTSSVASALASASYFNPTLPSNNNHLLGGSAQSLTTGQSAGSSSSDMSAGRFSAQVDRIGLVPRQVPLPPPPPQQYMRLPKHRRQPTEEEWIEQRKQFDEQEEGEGRAGPSRVEGGRAGAIGSVVERINAGVTYSMVNAEEVADWNVVTMGPARAGYGGDVDAGEQGRRESRSMTVGTSRTPEEERTEMLPTVSYQPEDYASHHGENRGDQGVLNGIEHVVDRVAGSMAKWVDGEGWQDGDRNRDRQ